jgi:hypothetical protein
MRQKFLAGVMLLGLTTVTLLACTTTRAIAVDPAAIPSGAARAPEAKAVTVTAGPFQPPAVAPTPEVLAALYKAMAPVEAYLEKSEAEEIAIARSAAAVVTLA